jgi:serine/threonine-protein kinase HipA
MGALEFTPSQGPSPKHAQAIDVQALVDLASEILTQRSRLEGTFSTPDRASALQELLRVGTSAGGARAKAIIAWNPETNTVRSGQVAAGKGFSYWLLKFDGVSGNRDKELEDPRGYGLIEYAYFLMARAAGIEMSDCRLLQEHGRSHFMARRFDRTDTGQKLHMQSLCALCHYDFNQPGAYSYEQALQAMRQLDLPMSQIEQQYRRMVFNIVARNQDDHVKNIAFLMDQSGTWSLSPAFDMTYSYNPGGHWTSSHQMTLNGKRDDFIQNDFVACEKNASMKRGRGLEILEQVQAAVQQWAEFAEAAGVPTETARRIAVTHRT